MTMKTAVNKGLDLPTLMSISIHDIKNDINHLISKVEKIEQTHIGNNEQKQNLSGIKEDAIKVNNQLVQLLALYKADEGLLLPAIDQHGVIELLEEKQNQYKSYCLSHQQKINILCDEELYAFFDEGLISSVLDSAIDNALRYASHTLCLRAEQVEEFCVIHVEDDGPGFPEEMLASPTSMQHINHETSNTGLGLHFAKEVLAQHKNKALNGKIRLQQSKHLGGACFSLFIP